MKIESLDRNVQQVLSTGYYRVPRFQRPYSWAAENLEEFWTDTIVDSNADYFIGAVIVFETSTNRFDVVDGQQRLTTLTIMLAALRDAFDAGSLPRLALGLHAFIERPNVGFEPEYVLQTETSYPFFHEHIQKHGPPDQSAIDIGSEEVALRRAKTFFAVKFAEVVESIKIDPRTKDFDKAARIESALADIRDKLLGLKLILVTVDDEDDAYTIFETLNSRGMNLTVSDLLKMYALHAREISAAPDAEAVALSVDALINKLRIPSEEIFVASFVELGYSTTSSKQKRLVKYVLDRHYAHHCSGAIPDLEQMTIEHLLPESPTAGSSCSPEDIANIGNLILVDENLNNKLANKLFMDKRTILSSAGQIWIDPMVLAANSWDRKAILARADAMARLAYSSIWKM